MHRLLVILALCSALAATAVAGQPAQATHSFYCVGAAIGGFGGCDGARHSLTANQAYNYYGQSYRVCAGAVDQNGNFYGSYACGYAFAQHCYSGANLLTPRIHNSESFTQTMKGQWFYNEQCP